MDLLSSWIMAFNAAWEEAKAGLVGIRLVESTRYKESGRGYPIPYSSPAGRGRKGHRCIVQGIGFAL